LLHTSASFNAHCCCSNATAATVCCLVVAVLLGHRLGVRTESRGEVTVVTLVSTQVLHCKYASCCTIVITSSCQDAECIPGLNFSTYTVVCCTSKICNTSV